MPTFRPTPDLTMHYEVDDFTDPWREQGDDPDAARQCRKQRRLVRLGPASRAPLSGGAPGYARLWRLDADAARLSRGRSTG